MKTTLSLFCLMGCLILTGCASNIVSTGNGTYMVAHRGPIWDTMSSLKMKCYRDADNFCTTKGLVMVPVSVSGHDAAVGVAATCELVFKAVQHGSPEDVPSIMVRSPDSVNVNIIEVRTNTSSH
jgi:hypothetical protein